MFHIAAPLHNFSTLKHNIFPYLIKILLLQLLKIYDRLLQCHFDIKKSLVLPLLVQPNIPILHP